MPAKRRVKRRIKLTVIEEVFLRIAVDCEDREKILSHYPAIWPNMTGRQFASFFDCLGVFYKMMVERGHLDEDFDDKSAFDIFTRHARVRVEHGFDDADAWRAEFDEPDWPSLMQLMRSISYNKVTYEWRLKNTERAA